MKPSTRCVHSGGVKDPASGGLNTPIYTSSAHLFLDRPDPPYPRYFNWRADAAGRGRAGAARPPPAPAFLARVHSFTGEVGRIRVAGYERKRRRINERIRLQLVG